MIFRYMFATCSWSDDTLSRSLLVRVRLYFVVSRLFPSQQFLGQTMTLALTRPARACSRRLCPRMSVLLRAQSLEREKLELLADANAAKARAEALDAQMSAARVSKSTLTAAAGNVESGYRACHATSYVPSKAKHAVSTTKHMLMSGAV